MAFASFHSGSTVPFWCSAQLPVNALDAQLTLWRGSADSFMDYDLGDIDLEEKNLAALESPFGPLRPPTHVSGTETLISRAQLPEWPLPV